MEFSGIEAKSFANKKSPEKIEETREMTYPDAVADFYQYVALRRILLIQETSGNEHNCTRGKMF